MDKKKIVNIIEMFFWILAVCLLIVFLYIKFAPKMELEKEAVIKENCRIFTERVLAKYDITKKSQYDIKKSVLEIVDDLNEERVNPYNKRKEAYVINDGCKGCLTVNIDEGTQSVVITGYDKKNHILTRTVIKPPSFVSYEKPEK